MIKALTRGFTIILVLFLIWFLNHSYENGQIKNIQVTEILGTETAPDYYSENMQLREYNKQGELISQVDTKRFSHYVEQRQAVLESPKLVIYGISGNIWEVTALTGSIADSNHNFMLEKNVNLSISDNVQQQKIMISTTDLHYNVANQTLWTDSEIIAESRLGSFMASGLEMDLNSEQLLLKQKVRIHYDL